MAVEDAAVRTALPPLIPESLKVIVSGMRNVPGNGAPFRFT